MEQSQTEYELKGLQAGNFILEALKHGECSSVLDSPLFGGAAAIVRQWGDVLDRFNRHAGSLKRRNRAFTTATRPLHTDVQLLHAKLDRLFSALLSRALAGEWSALATPFEAARSGACPTKCVAFRVCDGDRGVVERRLNMRDSNSHIPTNFLLFTCGHV